MIKEGAMKRYILAALIFALALIPSLSLMTSCSLLTPPQASTTTPSTDEPIYWGTLTGIVTENGVPVEGITVRSGSRTATTDADGSYSIKVYSDGATVSFEADGYITQSQTFKSSSFYRNEIEYSPLIFRSVRITGSVRDENGAAVEGATVSIGDRTALTDANGKYEFDGIIGTSMVILVSKGSMSGRGAFFTEDTLDGSHTVEPITIK